MTNEIPLDFLIFGIFLLIEKKISNYFKLACTNASHLNHCFKQRSKLAILASIAFSFVFLVNAIKLNNKLKRILRQIENLKKNYSYKEDKYK